MYSKSACAQNEREQWGLCTYTQLKLTMEGLALLARLIWKYLCQFNFKIENSLRFFKSMHQMLKIFREEQLHKIPTLWTIQIRRPVLHENTFFFLIKKSQKIAKIPECNTY